MVVVLHPTERNTAMATTASANFKCNVKGIKVYSGFTKFSVPSNVDGLSVYFAWDGDKDFPMMDFTFAVEDALCDTLGLDPHLIDAMLLSEFSYVWGDWEKIPARKPFEAHGFTHDDGIVCHGLLKRYTYTKCA
jgi:hypothetical protein